MKRIIYIAIVLLISLSCKAQSPIVLLSTYENIPNGAYLKDTNNELLKYTGTWQGVLDNKRYTFEFTKFEYHYDSYNLFYKDELLCKFKVIDLTTNTILYDDLSVYNFGDYKINALTPPKRGMLHCIFTDSDENCNNVLEFYLRNINGEPNKLRYCYFRYTDNWGKFGTECVNYQDRMMIPVFLPKEDLTLTKQ